MMEQIDMESDTVRQLLDGKTIAITGGTGSLGQKLVETLLSTYSPKRVIVISRSELRQADMKRLWPETDKGALRYFIRDVRGPLEDLAMALENVDIVIHAAAMKRIEVCEREPKEALLTNVTGTQNVISAARSTGVKQLLFISTDKAPQAATHYGSTKLAAERLIIGANNYRTSSGYPVCSCTRYGNVIASNGSVIAIWQEQARVGGPLTITDPAMTRFLITRDEAARFVLSCLPHMHGGEIFLPKLKATRMTDLAFIIAPQCKQVITGRRPGEKTHELLVAPEEVARTKDIGDRYVILPEYTWWPMSALANARDMPHDWTYTSESCEHLDPSAILKMIGGGIDVLSPMS